MPELGAATSGPLRELDVTRLIDERRLSVFNWLVVFVCFFVALADGYDIIAAAFASPLLVKQFGVSAASMGPVLSASLGGIFFGSLIFGWVGDRLGRRMAIMLSCLVIGVFTLACARVGSINELFWLRLFAGIGIGGMLPNIIALNAEFSPKRMRATLIIVMFTGVTFGGVLPGPVASWLVPSYGWPVLFLIGGVLPLVMALVVALALPESPKFLVLKGRHLDRALATLRRMEPGMALDQRTRLMATELRAPGMLHPGLLFRDGLGTITVLLWLLFICNQMVFYFVNSWLPTVLTEADIPLSHAAWATALFQFGGTVGGLVLGRPFDRRGFLPVAMLFMLALPVTALIGYTANDETVLMATVALSGFALLGLQFGLNAGSALIYPTAYRATGSGWAFAVGRLGSVAGPVIAGLLVGVVSIQHFFLVLALPLGIGVIASLALAQRYVQRFHGTSLRAAEVHID